MNAFSGFEGSFLGEAGKISDAMRLECKICWHVYDPAQGCEAWQIAPGTPFTALPKHWRCPNCDADPSGFMALDIVAPEAAVAVAPPVLPPIAAPVTLTDEPKRLAEARALGERFEEAFRELHRGRMRDVPFLNPALHVQAVNFRPYADERVGASTLGILITPWFMNLVLVPEEAPDPAPQVGTKSFVDFPSGRYEFIWSDRPETGPYRACSLFSPPSDFNSQLTAVDVAMAALAALFDDKIRDEGTRGGEIRALREAEMRKAAEAEAARAEAIRADAPAVEQKSETSDEAPAQVPASAPESATPSRRALFVPRASKTEPAAT